MATLIVKIIVAETVHTPLPTAITLAPIRATHRSRAEEKLATEENNVAECWTTNWEPGPQDGLLSTFRATGAQDCWSYCRVCYNCHLASYQLISGTCYLFNANFRVLAGRVGPGGTFNMMKYCMESLEMSPAGYNITEVVSLSNSGTGFLIQQDFRVRAC